MKAVFIVGPTAIGKTKYAINYALENNGEIVSADSMQIYKYMNIGSAKPTAEELSLVKHYLVDEIDPRQSFNVFDYQNLANQYIKEINDKGKLPVICGGTGLYVNSLIYKMDFSAPEGDNEYRNRVLEEENSDPEKLHERLRRLDPDAAEIIHPNNVKRVLRAIERLENGEEKLASFKDIEELNPELDSKIIYLNMDRELLYERINKRVDIMFEDGLLDEVKQLISMGFTSMDVAMKGIGYKEIIDGLNDGLELDQIKEQIQINTRHYAKRQITWFNRYKQAEIVNV